LVDDLLKKLGGVVYLWGGYYNAQCILI